MKSDISALAIFGGKAEFQAPLHVGGPNIGNRKTLMERIIDILDRRWLTNNGPYVQAFENKLAEYLGCRQCIAMCNGTIALEITARALELKGEVIVPSFTFIATAHALQWQEITPVFCDVDPKTHNIDPEKVEQLITPRTTGIMGVHVWGRPCEIEALDEIAEEYKLKLLFDASHAFGCTHSGKMIGNFGQAEIFSFHATKFFNTFEGGAVATNDDELAKKIRLMTNFGFAGYDRVVYLGTNGKMSEISAAMGITGMEALDEFILVNRQNYSCYQEELANIPGIEMICYDERERGNYQYIIIEIDKDKAKVSRDDMVRILQAENILARRYFYPGCHEMEPYRSYFPHARLLLPETEQLTQRVLSLPTGTAVRKEQVKRISKLIKLVIENGPEISTRLSNNA